ncbi:hypothetical protein SUDANB95_01446 [Actinosynnema sp. ALI-1.44]
MPRVRRTLLLPFTAHIAAWLVLGAAVAAVAAWALWLLAGRPQLTGTGPAGTQDRFEGVKIALAVAAGVGGVIALTVAYRKQRLGEAAERREDTKLFTDRFSGAAQLLGSDQAAVRLAGVYAMAALADDWEAHRQTCIDVLCAYLRMPHGDDVRDPDEERQVRHAVIGVVTQHLWPGAAVSWSGRTFDFTGARFDGGCFEGVRVTAGTRLLFTGAVFEEGRVSFRDADFAGGEVEFAAALVAGGTLVFPCARFGGAKVSFTRARFEHGRVDFGSARFTGGEVDFHLAEFSGARVEFSAARFAGGAVRLGTSLVRAQPPALDPFPLGPPPGLKLPDPPAHDDGPRWTRESAGGRRAGPC